MPLGDFLSSLMPQRVRPRGISTSRKPCSAHNRDSGHVSPTPSAASSLRRLIPPHPIGKTSKVPLLMSQAQVINDARPWLVCSRASAAARPFATRALPSDHRSRLVLLPRHSIHRLHQEC